MLLFLFRAVGWASVVAIVVASLVPGDARPDTGLPGQIDHIIAYCGTAGLLGLGYPAAKLDMSWYVSGNGRASHCS